jgi:hypothetical protein
MRPELLSEAVLTAFDRVLGARAPEVRSALRPGLSKGDVTARYLAAGIEPSQEATLWWSWFDAPPPDVEHLPLELLPDLEFLSVEVSVRTFHMLRRVARDVVTGTPLEVDEAWGSQWIPLFGIMTGGTIALDCSPGPDKPSPLRVAYPDEIGSPEYASIMAPSLGALITQATQWMNLATCQHDPDRGRWVPLDAWANEPPATRFLVSREDA